MPAGPAVDDVITWLGCPAWGTAVVVSPSSQRASEATWFSSHLRCGLERARTRVPTPEAITLRKWFRLSFHCMRLWPVELYPFDKFDKFILVSPHRLSKPTKNVDILLFRFGPGSEAER